MFGDLWNRLVRRRREEVIERETESERMSPAERRLTGESIEDLQADESAGEHLGGIDPGRLLGDDEPPRS